MHWLIALLQYQHSLKMSRKTFADNKISQAQEKWMLLQIQANCEIER